MKIVSLLFLLFVSLTLGAQDITGKWYGYPDLKNMRLRLEYHVEKAGGGYQVTLKIPDLSEKTYRADAVELADHCFVVQATEYFVVICAHLCITFLDRHDMLIPFCPADCLFLFSIKIIS